MSFTIPPGLSLTDARNQLSALVEKVERNEVSLDQLPEAIRQARMLLEYCDEKLRTISAEANEAGGPWLTPEA